MQIIFNLMIGSGTVLVAYLTGPLVVVFFALVLLLFFSVTFQRLHDIGHSGLWSVIWFVPGLHLVFLFYLLLRRGDSGPNKYGDIPDANIKATNKGEDLKHTFAKMDEEVEREEHETKLWSIIEHLVEVGVSEDDFAEELGRRYDMLDGRKGNLFLSREGNTWWIKVSSSQYPHIETDYEFSIDG
jgi:hypothetical protein